jgi:hypothetical protein
MSTFDERLRALKDARAWMVAVQDMPTANLALKALQDQATVCLQDYPSEAQIEGRLIDLRGYRLLLAVGCIERVRDLIDSIHSAAGQRPEWYDNAQEAKRIARHFPELVELALAVRTPQTARAWAAFYLDRAPGRMGLLLAGNPPPWSGSSRGRREALRNLPSLLQRLARDPLLPALALAHTQQLLLQLPSRAEQGSRWAGMSVARFNQAMAAIQRACQLAEAVMDGTWEASHRSRILASRWGRHLPNSEGFPVASSYGGAMQAWRDWLWGSKLRLGLASQISDGAGDV